jgi:hypothetical protein
MVESSFRGNLLPGVSEGIANIFPRRLRSHFLRPCRVEKPASAVLTDTVGHLPVFRAFGLIQSLATPGTYSFHRSSLLIPENATPIPALDSRTSLIAICFAHSTYSLILWRERVRTAVSFDGQTRVTLCGIARSSDGRKFQTLARSSW